jgi:hypothetical protein
LETWLAREHLRHAQAFSDPDLPRLWTALNGLAHAVPAEVLLTVPAANHGPIAATRPTRDDLIGWAGVYGALRDLDAVVAAAGEGRAWLARTARPHSADDALLAVGVADLTHPLLAAELARCGPAAVPFADVGRLLDRLPAPACPVELSDAAVKACCDRAGYLLGTPDERTCRELVERRAPAAVTDEVRARLARGDTAALTRALRELAPTDDELDRHVWRHDPPQPDARHLRQLLGEASREALSRFAGRTVRPHPGRALALLARYPERALRTGLRLDPGAGRPAAPEPPDVAPRPADPPAPAGPAL